MTDSATELMHSAMPFTAELGIEVVESSRPWYAAGSPGRRRNARQAVRCTAGRSWHWPTRPVGSPRSVNLPDGMAGTSTIESKTNFFRPLASGYATATAQPLHVGRRTIVVETEVHADNGKLVAKVTQTQAVL
jgi:acyl-coenzyme A thioesterase PaaI-like protein